MSDLRPLCGAGDPIRDFATSVAEINDWRRERNLPPLDPELVEDARPRKEQP